MRSVTVVTVVGAKQDANNTMAVQGPTSGIPEGKTIRRRNDQFEEL